MFEQKPKDFAYRYTLVGKNILDLIESGALKPGDRIPSLRNMGTRMRVSVTTVLQAYMDLEGEGVIESRPKSGFFVCADSMRLPPTPAPGVSSPIEPRELNRSELIGTVRDLLGRTDILPFAVACPDASLLPARDLGRIMASVLRQDPLRTIGYEMVRGNLELRKQIAFRCIDAGASVMPDEIIVTNGAMEAIFIAVRCLTRPGDAVVIQSPAYYCFMHLFDTLGLRVIEIPSRPEGGISPTELADAVNQYDVKACIFNLNFNNPDGSVVPDEAKRELVSLLSKKGIPLIEDDVSGDIHFGPERPPVCLKYDKEGLVMLCSSFSKTIAPGYRVGWLIPGRFFNKAQGIKVDTSVCTASPSQVAIAEFLRTGRYERHLKRLRTTVEKQMRSTQLAISRYFPADTKVTRPAGGLALWVELPQHVDSRDLFFRARAEGIGIVPGLICSTFDKYRNFIRITCGGIWNRQIEKGIETLGQLAS
ncbi:MAG: PLP-dependent aminotransferase family protein [Syntrophobacteraceae bacterium]